MNIFKTKLLGLALAGLILGACSQTGTYETADLMNEQAAAEKAGFKLNPLGTVGNANAAVLSGGGDCNSDCIDETSGDLFAATGLASRGWGGPQQNLNSKTLSVKVWNTLATIEYEFTITGSGNAYGPGKLQYFDETNTTDSPAGTWVDYPGGTLTTGVAFSVSRPLDENWEACDIVSEQWRQEGNGGPVSLGDVSYSLIGECGCEESFSYVENQDGTITFTYVPEEDMDDANVVLTFAQSAVVTIPGFTKNGATMQATIDLEACETYTWIATISELRCIGQGQDNVNVWTDMTVNEDSKKNEGTPNIVRACSN